MWTFTSFAGSLKSSCGSRKHRASIFELRSSTEGRKSKFEVPLPRNDCTFHEGTMQHCLPSSFGVFACVAFLVPNVFASEKIDPSGVWQIVVERPGRPRQESILRLEKSGSTFVGVMMDALGRSTPIRDAKLDGEELSFRIKIQRDGREFGFTYKGKVTADAFKGLVSINVLGINRSAPFTGKRMKDEGLLPGLWKITLTMEDGQKVQPALRLKKEGGKLSGTYLGTAGKELPLNDLLFKNGELSFQVADNIDGDKVRLRYTGKLAGETLKGTVTFGEGNQLVTLKFEARKDHAATAKIAGTWKLKVSYQAGVAFEPTLKLVQNGNSLSGVYVGPHAENPINDALIFGDEFTFEVNRERDGHRYRLRYQGRAKGDTLSGGVDYDFDGLVGSLEFQGKRIGGPDGSSLKRP
jgi:hypothetical protein